MGHARPAWHRWRTAVSVVASAAHRRARLIELLHTRLRDGTHHGWADAAIEHEHRVQRGLSCCVPCGLEALMGHARPAWHRCGTAVSVVALAAGRRASF